MADNVEPEVGSDGNFVSKFVSELLSSPLNLALLALCGFLLYKIIIGRKKQIPAPPREPQLPELKKQDMTLEQLREYDGKGPDGRILVAANGKVFDVTRGKRFYGPGKRPVAKIAWCVRTQYVSESMFSFVVDLLISLCHWFPAM